MAELADISRQSHSGAKTAAAALPPLLAIDREGWQQLAAAAIEPNGYGLPDWALAANGSPAGRATTLAISARDGDSGALTGLLPVTSAWRALRLPLPALVSADPYHSLGTPLLAGPAAEAAAGALLDRARAAGAHALLLRYLPQEGATAAAFTAALAARGLQPRVLKSYARACLDATRDPDALLRDALGPKKLKELRRLRNRLSEHGAVSFNVARDADEVALGFDAFLSLEASGWKGRRGTALAQHPQDAARLRSAALALAARGACEIVTLSAGARPVAAGIVLRHQDRAFFFKLGIDAGFAKYSPGVQLTLELTRHLCADPAIALADSTAAPGHPMIDPIWRGRLQVADLLLPLRRHDPVFALIHLALRTHGWLRSTVARVMRR